MIDRPLEREQISMIMRSLQPSYARHLMGVPIMDYRDLIEALYGIEDGMTCGLWSNSSSSDSKGKKPSIPLDMGHPGLSMHLYGHTGLPTPRVQFSIDLSYHLSHLGYQLHIFHHT